MYGRGSAFTTHAEAADEVDQFVGVAGQRFGRCGGLLGHGGILLGGGVELIRRRGDRAQRRILLGGAVGDLGDDLVGGLDLVGDALQRLACLADQTDAMVDLAGGAGDL